MAEVEAHCVARRPVSDTPAYLNAANCPGLRTAWRYSRSALQALTAAFEAQAAHLPDVVTVAVGGSLGRYEAGAASDVDCIVVVRDGAASAHVEVQNALVHRLFAESTFKPPKADGIYRQGIARRALLDPAALGSLDEAPAVFGKRIQLLLDARPVFGRAGFDALQRDIVAWYCTDFVVAKPTRTWTYLCNDLMRYLHSYAGWQQFKFERGTDDSWQLRQAKFRTSRLLTFAATMYLLGESDGLPDKVSWLQSQLADTPLQRLYTVMQRHDAAAYAQLLAAYEAAFALLVQPELRAALVASGPDAATRMRAELHPVYEQIREHSAALSRILTEFALTRRAQWGARFFERWLF